MNARFIAVDAEYVKARIADLMAVYPELADDDVLKLDMFEAETDLLNILTKAVAHRFEAESMVSAIKERASDLEARKARFTRQSEAMKKLIKSLMEAAGESKITLPEATLSIAKGREKIVVDDVNELSQGFFRTERIADKDAIKFALDAGESVPGAHKETGEPSLVVRSK
jgi:hypothetical protein